ncbi:MAG: FxsA family protein [Actinomycetales bacterium]
MSQRRNWPVWILVGVLVAPLLEIVVLIAVGRQIGLWATVGLLVLVAAVGALLLRREGPRSLRALREASTGVQVVDGVEVYTTPSLPTRELSDSALVALGAMLLVLPGFVSDILAIICLLPVTRSLPRSLFAALIRRRIQHVSTTMRPAVRTEGFDQGKAPGAGERRRDDDGPIPPDRILPPA